jgi:hypothetical protein
MYEYLGAYEEKSVRSMVAVEKSMPNLQVQSDGPNELLQ